VWREARARREPTTCAAYDTRRSATTGRALCLLVKKNWEARHAEEKIGVASSHRRRYSTADCGLYRNALSCSNTTLDTGCGV